MEKDACMLGRIIYRSTSLCESDEIPSIVDQARTLNARSDVSGALFTFGGRFLQYLEGEEDVVYVIYQRITNDRRHTDCRLLDRRLISTRIFKGWPMTSLPHTIGTNLLIEALVPQRGHVGAIDVLDASSAGAFFYALSKLSQRL